MHYAIYLLESKSPRNTWSSVTFDPIGTLEIYGDTGICTEPLDVSLDYSVSSDHIAGLIRTQSDQRAMFYKSGWIPPLVIPESGGTTDDMKNVVTAEADALPASYAARVLSGLHSARNIFKCD